MVEALLSALRREGVRLWCENGRLHYQAPKGALTAPLLSEIRAQQAKIVAFLKSSIGGNVPSIVPEQHIGTVPLSFAQERLWFLEQLGVTGSAYNVSVVVRCVGHLDLAALSEALSEVVRRHEAVRTRCETRDGGGVQIIDPPWRVQLKPVA